MRFRRLMVSVMAFLMVATLLPASASASDFKLRIEDVATGQGVVVTDPGVGTIFQQFDIILDPLHPDPTDPLFKGTSSFTIGFVRPFPVTTGQQLANVRLQELVVITTGAATLKLTLEDRGYTDVGNLLVNNHVFAGTWGTTGSGSSVTTTSWANESNQVPGLGGDQAGGLPPITPATGVSVSSSRTFNSAAGDFGSAEDDYSTDTSAAFTGGALGYSLWSEVLITFSGAGSLSFNHDTFTTQNSELNNTPEPGSLMLIGTGIVGLVTRMRRRKESVAGN